MKFIPDPKDWAKAALGLITIKHFSVGRLRVVCPKNKNKRKNEIIVKMRAIACFYTFSRYQFNML